MSTLTSTQKLARWIYNYCESNNIEDLSNIKMQKLLYYCSGITNALGCFDVPLATFEAWKYGPVNEECYQEFKVFGADKISMPYEDIKYSEESTKVLESVMDIYSHLEPFELVEQTHVEEPWSEAWGNGDMYLSEASILTYFKGHYQVGNSRPPSTVTGDGFFFIDRIPVPRFKDIHDVAEFIKNSGNI